MSDHRHLRELLVSAVPTLSSPQDRLGAVLDRARRSRRRQVTSMVASIVAVSVAVVASLMASTRPGNTTEPVAKGCPKEHVGMAPTTDQPGPLVTADGVVSISLCDLPFLSTTPAPVKTLTNDTSSMVEVLNGLPDREEMVKRLKDRGGDPTRVDYCHVMGVNQPSFLVTYADGSTRLLIVDYNCFTIHGNGHVRYIDPDPVAAFLNLYKIQ